MSILKLSELENGIRIDAELYEREYIRIEKLLKSIDHKILGREAAIIKKGIFNINSSVYTNEGIPFVRISNLKNMVIDENDIVYIPKEENDKNLVTFLSRSDIILSKTAYAAASLVTLENCNTSQDTVAVKLKDKSSLDSHYVVVFFNTYYGLKQMRRWFTGNIQMHLNLADSKEMLIPYFSNTFQTLIKKTFKQSLKAKEISQNLYTNSEEQLIKALGLSDYKPSKENVQVKSLKDSFLSSGRLDAEYYQPKYQELLKILFKSNLTIGDVATISKRKFKRKKEGYFNYIQISDLTKEGYAKNEKVLMKDAPSRATWIVNTNDIVTSTVRPIRRLSALIDDKQNGSICSSGFAVLTAIDIEPEVLLVFLRLTLVCEILDLNTTASMYPAISNEDLLKIPFAKPNKAVRENIVNAIQTAKLKRTQSKQLLKIAKTGMEKAIENSEEYATNYMKNELKNI